MFTSDIKEISKAAHDKKELAYNKKFVYFMRSVVAGFYIIVATILSNVTGAVLFNTFPQWGKLLSSFLFTTALILIIFLGGELFTGNNLTMAIGAFDKKVSWKDAIYVWMLTYVGNLVGCIVLGTIFYFSGSSKDILVPYYESFIMGKLTISATQMVLRGILCNFCVCLAVLTNIRMKTEGGKLCVMYMVIMAFVLAGFEHCVANMGAFTLGFLFMGGLPINLLLKSFFFVTIGNIIGGGFILGLPLYAMSYDNTK